MLKSEWVQQVTRIEKPWGHEEVFALVEGMYCGKVLHIRSGEALSLHYHEQKDETLSVQAGRIVLVVGYDDETLETFEVGAGEGVRLRPGVWHRLTAVEDAIVLEASTTELTDVVRLEDRYGRTD